VNDIFIERLQKARAELAEAETTVIVLRRLLTEAEGQVRVRRSLVQAGEDREARERAAAVTYPNPYDEALSAEERMTVAEKQAHDREFMPVNHQSGCALNSFDLREKFLDWLNNHGTPGHWVPRTAMCYGVDAWLRWGKRVVDPTIDSMVAEGLIQVQSDGNRKFVRLVLGRPRNPDAPTVGSVLNEVY
jgi:hypothetical protein